MESKITFTIALLLGISLVSFLSREPYAFAQNYTQPIEVFDCTVQGNSTYEISGPCPDSDIGTLKENSTSSLENNYDGISKPPESKPLISTDTLLPDVSGLTDPFRPSK